MEESERKLNDYARSRKNILTLDEKTNVLNQTFTEYSTALTKAEQEVIKTDSDYEAIRTAPDTSRQVLESKTIQDYKAQISKLDQDYQEAAKVYKDDFPKMKQLRAQMDELNGRIKAEVQSILASVRNQAQIDQAAREPDSHPAAADARRNHVRPRTAAWTSTCSSARWTPTASCTTACCSR
ncbi:MAG: hypothetical protein V9G23_18975 [Giesbergeria sp.]